MTRTVGYTRQLFAGHDVDAESEELRKAGASRVFVDAGGVATRKEFDRCLAALRPSDTLLVTSAVVMATSVENFVSTSVELERRSIHLCSLAEPSLSTTPGTSTTPIDVLRALDGLRRRWIGLKTREGLDAAASAGRRPGRPRVMTEDRLEVARELRMQKRSFAQIGRALGVSEAAVRRALKAAESDQSTLE